MRLLESIEDIQKIDQPIAVALGNFDGVHKGHQALLRQCVNESHDNSWTSGVFTLHPHPAQIINKHNNMMFINTPDQKRCLIEKLGINYYMQLSFTEEMAFLEPQEFIKNYLCELICVKKVFVGYNYTFGKGGKGNPELLQEAGNKYGFEVFVMPPYSVNNTVVSSSLIRKMYLDGNISAAAELLGYWPYFEGLVAPGMRRGREMGYPTANIAVAENTLLPALGVYAGILVITGEKSMKEGTSFPAVVNIGKKPTFGGDEITVEAHVLDYTGDLYKKRVRLHIINYLRNENVFKNPTELSLQIAKDVEKARNVIIDTLGKTTTCISVADTL